jgi:predicted transcriptional regulator of viral defense system
MTAADAIGRLRELDQPAVTTADAAALFGTTIDAANKTLTRLRRARLVARVRRGLWSVDPQLDPLLLPDRLTAPYPSYVSLLSALRIHGMISQIPQVTYVVSLDRTRRIRTSVGTFSVHHVAPEMFGGFDVLDSGAKLATPEKALVDVFYLSGTRTRLFTALPELELPPAFRAREARAWANRIGSRRLRTIVLAKLDALLGSRPGSGRARSPRRGR